MVTIELDGYIVSGSTLKEAQRLARKEQKRQAKRAIDEEEKRAESQSNAYDQAWANLGRIASLLEKNPRCLTVEEPRAYREESPDGLFLLVEAPRQDITGRVPFYPTDTLHKILINNGGYVWAYLVSYGQEAPKWYAVGTYEGKTASVEIPVSIASQLYGLMSQQKKAA